MSTSFSRQKAADKYFLEPSLREMLGEVCRPGLTKAGQESWFSMVTGDQFNSDVRMGLWWFDPLPITAGDMDYLQIPACPSFGMDPTFDLCLNCLGVLAEKAQAGCS